MTTILQMVIMSKTKPSSFLFQVCFHLKIYFSLKGTVIFVCFINFVTNCTRTEPFWIKQTC